MKQMCQRITGWISICFFFLLPVKFGTLGLMPEQPPMFPEDLLTLSVISWPVYGIGIAGALLLAASVLFFPVPRWRTPGGLTALLWGLGLPLAVLPGLINCTNRDYAFITLVHWWGMGAFILSAWWIFSAENCWKKRALNALAAGALVTGIEGWRQYIWGFDEMVEMIRKQREAGMEISPIMEIRILDGRVFSSLGSCNTFAGFLLLTIPAVLMVMREWGKRFEPVKVSQILFCAVGTAVLLPPLFMTRSRGAWLCAFLTGVLWFFTRNTVKLRYKLAVGLAGLLLIAGAGVLMHRSGRGLLSGSERLDYLRTAAIMCVEHPLTGGGWGEFFHRHMVLKTTTSDESARSPHNLTASFASQAGIPAGAVALGAVVILLLELFRCKSKDPVYLAGRWGIAAFLLHSCMEINDSIVPSVICCAAGALALMETPAAGENDASPSVCYRYVLKGTALLTACAAFYTSTVWLQGEAAFEKLEQALHPRNIQKPVAPPEPARVLELFRQTEKFRPRSPYPCELVGDFLLQVGETEGAVIFFERSRSYVPGRPAVYRRLALAACERNDFEAARNYLTEAGKRFPADPKNQEKRFFEEWKRRKQGKKL